MMSSSRIILALFLAVVLGDATDAFAWGPAVHTGLGNSVLGQLSMLPAAVAAIIGRHKIAYLYGNIAADVVFAKRLSRVKQSCHHWSTGFRLLYSAKGPRAQSFAYGYLAHLAADTVAHGKFIPHQIVHCQMPVNIGHLYWELRADAMESDETWRELASLLDQDHAQHHRELAIQIRDTFLSYRLNRLLFDGITALAAHRSFRHTVDIWHQCSGWHLAPEFVRGYQLECLDRIFAILTDGPTSPITRDDPNGTSALMNASVQRRDQRRFRRRGRPIHGRRREAALGLAPRSPIAGAGQTETSPSYIGATVAT